MANNAILFRTEHKSPVVNALKDFFKTTKWESWFNYVKHTHEDFEFIRVRDDDIGERWVLSPAVKNNSNFAKLKEIIGKAGSGAKMVYLRKVDLPEYFLEKEPDYSKPII